MKAITDHGFIIPDQIKRQASNALRNKHYDQIAFIAPDIQDKLSLFGAGVFDYYKYVYRAEDEERYASAMGPAYLKTRKASRGIRRGARGITGIGAPIRCRITCRYG
jgi:hypothetical protein